MKHPVWVINSLLLLLLVLMIVIMAITKPSALKKVNFLPDVDVRLPKKEAPVKDLRKIYLNDLFNTYKKTTTTTKEGEAKREAMPPPPTPQPPKVQLAPPPKFLEPLSISLKGIIIAQDDTHNVAIIEKNSVTTNYKVGDRIDDAQLIRIMHNKIILIRSNGQQETLYVNKADADEDQMLLMNNNWSTVVKKVNDNAYNIDPQAFVHHIRSLAQFIDLLNLTTVFVKGESIGCRIGRVSASSLVYALGLQPSDIITSVNDISAADTQNRFEIYKKIVAMNNGDTISVNITRSSMPITITYLLQPMVEHVTTLTVKNSAQMVSVERVDQMQDKEFSQLLKERKRFAPTVDELQRNNKYAMMNHGSKNSQRARNIVRNSVSNENQWN